MDTSLLHHNRLIITLHCFLVLTLDVLGTLGADVYWPLEQIGTPEAIGKYTKMLNKECKIQRIPLGPDGRPATPSPTPSGRRRRRSDIDPKYDDHTKNGSSRADSRGISSGVYSNSTRTHTSGQRAASNVARVQIEDVYKPITDLVIDPCQDEENRSFMECVLYFRPNITDSDPDYNKGTCLCYRDWAGNRIPAYNHELNYTMESSEWFVWNIKMKECVIRTRKRCAPTGTLIVPYHCEPVHDPDHGESEGHCVDSDQEPHFMVCVAKGSIFLSNLAVILTGLLFTNLIY